MFFAIKSLPTTSYIKICVVPPGREKKKPSSQSSSQDQTKAKSEGKRGSGGLSAPALSFFSHVFPQGRQVVEGPAPATAQTSILISCLERMPARLSVDRAACGAGRMQPRSYLMFSTLSLQRRGDPSWGKIKNRRGSDPRSVTSSALKILTNRNNNNCVTWNKRFHYIYICLYCAYNNNYRNIHKHTLVSS